jgi:hypothetical protein
MKNSERKFIRKTVMISKDKWRKNALSENNISKKKYHRLKKLNLISRIKTSNSKATLKSV